MGGIVSDMEGTLAAQGRAAGSRLCGKPGS
jgi:hypothetical protein